MGPGEIAARVRERLPAPALPRPRRWPTPERQALRERLECGFLFGPERSRAIAETWRRQRPRESAEVVERARRGLERWDIFGVPVALEAGRVNWLEGPGAGRFDRRWVWELNRQQFLFTFARAFVLTGDAVFARRIVELVDDWRKKNPFGKGVNWSSALEVGVRAISWLWALPLVLDWPELDDRALNEWVAGLYEHYEYLKGHLSLYTDPTNHLIGEAAALRLLGTALPDTGFAERDEQRLGYLLGREIQRQVSADGVSLEQSTGYQRFVLDFYLQVVAVERRQGRPAPAVIEQRVTAMLEFLAALCGEDGEAPAIGDSDDARGVPFPELSGWNFQDVLSAGAVLLGRPEWNARAPEVAYWLAGPETAGIEAPWLPLGRAAASRTFPKGGYCFWEAVDNGRRIGLLFDAGPLGLWPNAAHGHADALSVQVKLGGRWVLADSGTGAYSSQRRVRDALRATAAHNTVTVDNLDQTDALEVFKWLKPVETRLLDHCSQEAYDFALGVHEGYRRLRQPVTHYRAVLFVRPPAPRVGWIVADRLEGQGRHHCALRFHFPPGARLQGEGPQAVRIVDAKSELVMQFSEAAPGAKPVYRIDPAGLWSRRFGHWEAAPVLVIERKVELPLAWVTYLTPHGEDSASSVQTLERRGDAVVCRRVWEGIDESFVWHLTGGEHRVAYRRSGSAAGGFCFP